MTGPGGAGSASGLEHASLLAQLEPAMVAQLVKVASRVELRAGDWLFRDGDEGDSMFIVDGGRLEVLDLEDPETKPPIRVLVAGDVVGELALLCRAPRSASVRAVRDCTLLEISYGALLELFRADESFALALLHTVGEKLRTIAVHEAYVERGPRVLGVVPLGPAMRDAAVAIATEMSTAVGGWGRVVCVTRESVRDEPAGWSAHVDALEDEHDVVLLVGDSEPAPDGWNEFCTRQSDRVLAVVDSRPSGPVDARSTWDLVVCRQATHPTVVRRWLQRVRPRAHHLVRDGHVGEDVQRLARRVLGRSVGLVLSGGGARGLAHLGVIEVLVQSGITIDRVGGTSMGAFVSALFASGRSSYEQARVCRTELVDRHPFRDFTLPRTALIRARRAEAMLERIFGFTHLEDLAVDLFCVSADLTTAEVVVHRDGPVVEAVGASMSLPGLAPPVRSGARLLVDGGVLNNVPVDVMEATREGPVIAVDVLSRLPVGGHGKLPSIVETLARASVIGSHQQAPARLATAAAVIEPAVGTVGLLDFSRFDEIVDAGRRAARDAIDRGALEHI